MYKNPKVEVTDVQINQVICVSVVQDPQSGIISDAPKRGYRPF